MYHRKLALKSIVLKFQYNKKTNTKLLTAMYYFKEVSSLQTQDNFTRPSNPAFNRNNVIHNNLSNWGCYEMLWLDNTDVKLVLPSFKHPFATLVFLIDV